MHSGLSQSICRLLVPSVIGAAPTMRLTLSRAGSGAPAAAAAASAAVAWPPRGLGTPPKAPAAPRLSLHRWKHLRESWAWVLSTQPCLRERERRHAAYRH